MASLTEKWVLQFTTRTSNGTGGWRTTRTDGAVIWGERPAQSETDEVEIAAGLATKTRRMLRLRWRPDLESGGWLKEARGGREWLIIRTEDPLIADDLTDPETRERRHITEKARVHDFVAAAAEGTAVTGASAECRDAYGLSGNVVPYPVFEPIGGRPVETRAATPAPTDGPVAASPTQPFIYGRTHSSWLGVDMVPVSDGAHVFPSLSTATPSGMKTKGSSADETAAAFTADAKKPKRATGSARFRYEDLSVFPEMEVVLRADIPRSLANTVDQQIVAGSGSGGQLASLVSQLTAATAETTRETLVRHVAKAAELVDGTYASELSQIRQLIGLETYVDASSLFSTTDSETAESWLSRRTGGLRGAPVAWIAATSGNKQAGIARRGMHPMSAAVALWGGGIRLIRDELSSAASGEVIITSIQLLSDVVIVHESAFKALSFKLA